MQNTLSRLLLFVILAVSQYCSQAFASEKVIIHKPFDPEDKRQAYLYSLAQLVLEASKSKYGDYSFETSAHSMSGERQLFELAKGENLTLTVSPPKNNWEKKVLRVPFPLQKGISSFRVFFVTEQNKNLLAGTKTLSQLRRFSLGQARYWSSVKILRDSGLQVVLGNDYKGLFYMLDKGRFQLFLRGINEAAIEIEAFKSKFPQLRIDEHLIVFYYLPNYFYVSPGQVRLAERLEYGLKALYEDGRFDEHFRKYYGNILKSYDFTSRNFIYLDNTHIDAKLFEKDKPYLLKFSDLIHSEESS